MILDAARRRSLAQRSLLVATLALGAIALPRAALAQVPLAPLPVANDEDARTLPRGTVRLRVLNAWTRYDELFAPPGDTGARTRPLGSAFSTPSLGTSQLAVLAPAENALRALTGDATFRLDAGRLTTTADTRVVTTPIVLEYGVSRRLTIGAMVPIVQTRSTVSLELNPQGSSGFNVGANPARNNSASSLAADAAVHAALQRAFADLDAAIRSCATDPSAPICARQPEAARVRDTSAIFRDAVRDLYGIDAATGSPFAPLGTTQTLIQQRLTAFDARLQSLLGQSYLPAAGTAGATGPAALFQLQQLTREPNGIALDSIGSPERLFIGDVEVSAAFLVADGFRDTVGRSAPRLRALLRGAARFGTGKPADGLVPFDVGTGTGVTSADGGAVVDLLLFPRVLTTVAGRYTAYLGDAPVTRIPGADFALFPLGVPVPGTWRPGDALEVDATPRYLITKALALHGLYSFRRQAASRFTATGAATVPLFEATTQQRAGVGFSYSTLASYARGRNTIPLEITFSHLETLTSSTAAPKYTRDQIELRLYYRLLRGAP